jgi:hypothetical protein
MAQSRTLVYCSIKYEDIYHTCTNCHGGGQIGRQYRRVITEKEAKAQRMRKCKRCILMEATNEPCEPVTE